jgi:hypothetical protein
MMRGAGDERHQVPGRASRTVDREVAVVVRLTTLGEDGLLP